MTAWGRRGLTPNAPVGHNAFDRRNLILAGTSMSVQCSHAVRNPCSGSPVLSLSPYLPLRRANFYGIWTGGRFRITLMLFGTWSRTARLL